MARANSLADKMRKDYARNRIIFHYVPMVGIIVGFKNYSPRLGIFGSHWVGLKWFKQFFSSFYFERVMRNTLMISFQDIILGFPLPILLAIMFNEIHCTAFKRCVQTISYLPYFILTALYRHRFHAPWEKCGMDSSYNGSAMRAIPLGLWHGKDTRLLWQDCAVSCYTTHANPTALASTSVMAYAAAYLSRVDVTDFDGGMLLSRLIDLSRQVEAGLAHHQGRKCFMRSLKRLRKWEMRSCTAPRK